MALAQHTGRESLRTLGPLEEFFWRSGLSWPVTIYLTAHVELHGERPDWTHGGRAVQERYEHLRISVQKSPGLRPVFVSTSAPLPIRVLPLHGQGVASPPYFIDDATLGYAEPVLASLLIFANEVSAQVTLALNHCVIDGLGAVSIVQDFLAAAMGEQLAGKVELPSSVNDLFEAGCQERYSGDQSRPVAPRHLGIGFPHISEAVMDRSATERLRVAARVNNTTVQGALLAAFFEAARRCYKPWNDRNLLCLSPFDLRRFLTNAESTATGLLIGVQPIASKAGDRQTFWECARQVRAEIVAGLNVDTVKQGLKWGCAVVADEGDPGNPDTVDPMNLLAHELMVTNMGAPDVRTEFGSLRLTHLFPAVCGGFDPQTQTISAVTINGQLCLTHLSPSPIKQLLPTAIDILNLQSMN